MLQSFRHFFLVLFSINMARYKKIGSLIATDFLIKIKSMIMNDYRIPSPPTIPRILPRRPVTNPNKLPNNMLFTSIIYVP